MEDKIKIIIVGHVEQPCILNKIVPMGVVPVVIENEKELYEILHESECKSDKTIIIGNNVSEMIAKMNMCELKIAAIDTQNTDPIIIDSFKHNSIRTYPFIQLPRIEEPFFEKKPKGHIRPYKYHP